MIHFTYRYLIFVLIFVGNINANTIPIHKWEWVNGIYDQITEINERFHSKRLILTGIHDKWLHSLHDDDGSLPVQSESGVPFGISMKGVPEQAFVRSSWINAHWLQGAGYKVVMDITPSDALNVILALPLVNYKLANDPKQEITTRSSLKDIEMRLTRDHIGIIDTEMLLNSTAAILDDTNTIVDSNTLFYINLRAISHIEKQFLRSLEKLNELEGILTSNGDESIKGRIKDLNDEIASKNFKTIVESINDFDSEIEVVKELTFRMMQQNVKSETRLRGLRVNSMSQVARRQEREQYVQHMDQIEDDAKLSWELDFLQSEIDTDIKIIKSSTNSEIQRLQEGLTRDLKRLEQLKVFEVDRARKEIMIELELERQFEDLSLNRIRILGEEMMKEVTLIIQHCFDRLAGSMYHALSTEEGFRDFLLVVLLVSLISFAISISKEFAIMLVTLVRKQLISPRLVREYGNTMRFTCRTSDKGPLLREVVLPIEVKGRVEKICHQISVSTKRKKLSSQRNILIHGPPGCGKTILAKALCHHFPYMPFALICSSDIAPLGKHAPLEMQHVLSWAEKGRSGRIVIIEDVEYIFGTRTKHNHKEMGGNTNESIASYSRDTLNVFLSMTGKACNNFMLILTTCYPQSIDEAVLDRMDEYIPLSTPGKEEKFEILRQEAMKLAQDIPQKYTRNHLGMITEIMNTKPQTGTGFLIDKDFDLSKAIRDFTTGKINTETCTGRQLHKFMHRIATIAQAQDNHLLTQEIWDTETDIFAKELAMKGILINERNRY